MGVPSRPSQDRGRGQRGNGRQERRETFIGNVELAALSPVGGFDEVGGREARRYRTCGADLLSPVGCLLSPLTRRPLALPHRFPVAPFRQAGLPVPQGWRRGYMRVIEQVPHDVQDSAAG